MYVVLLLILSLCTVYTRYIQTLLFTLFYFTEFAVLNSNYYDLLQSFPENLESTLTSLLDHFTDEQAMLILDSPTALDGNQKMLNILIGQLTQKIDVISLCDSLDKIGDATLSKAVKKLRNGKS